MTIESDQPGPKMPPRLAGDCRVPLEDAVCTQIVTAHGPLVKAACFRILRDNALAEDAAQEVFLLFIRKLPLLPSRTVLAGWLYGAACNVARTLHRSRRRRVLRESGEHAAEHLINMNSAQNSAWHELEPLLDDAMLALTQRQRELVLLRYFHENTQRTAAELVGCSESVASRELSSAISVLRRFFERRGVIVTESALIALLAAHGAQASLCTAAIVSAISSASSVSVSTAPVLTLQLLLALMKSTTTSKILIAAVAALLLTSGAIHFITRRDTSAVPRMENAAAKNAPRRSADGSPAIARPRATAMLPSSPPSNSGAPRSALASGPAYDEAALKAAREKVEKLETRIRELALITDPRKVQQTLKDEYGIRLSVEDIQKFQSQGQKGFTFGLLRAWAANQPREALAWAVGGYSEPSMGGYDFHQFILETAGKALQLTSRAQLDSMLPEGPGRIKILDLLESRADPTGLASRILSVTDPAERTTRLRVLAQGWGNSETAADWARQNLDGVEKSAFYQQLGYNLAHQNPQAALRVLDELTGTDVYASTFNSMMRGLVQSGGQGPRIADMIANSDLKGDQRADLISELSRRWVRSDPDATIAWVNNLTAPEDFRAAIPLLVSQLDNARVVRTVEAFLKNHDPVMELALMEAAAPPGLLFEADKSRMILDPIIKNDPALKIVAGDENAKNRDAVLWSSVNQAARRQAESGDPATAMQWLATLPFASDGDYAKAIGNVMRVWNIKAPDDANTWLQNATLNAGIKTEARNVAQSATQRTERVGK